MTLRKSANDAEPHVSRRCDFLSGDRQTWNAVPEVEKLTGDSHDARSSLADPNGV